MGAAVVAKLRGSSKFRVFGEIWGKPAKRREVRVELANSPPFRSRVRPAQSPPELNRNRSKRAGGTGDSGDRATGLMKK